MYVAADADVELRLTGAAQPLRVKPGTHVMKGVMPAATALAAARARLTALLEQGRAEREELLAAAGADQAAELPELPPVATGSIGGKPVASLTWSDDAGEVLALAEGTTVHLLRPDATEIRTLTTDGEIKCMTWWDEHRLLLVGCKDEKVIAFDESGARAWEFTSEMDQAVWEAAKQYWFKSALPGIYGLHTGMFIGGESQCFVGSACTLEILDARGKLIKRMPIFWGPGWRFLLVDGPGGSVNLLVARWPNGTDALAIVNSDGPRLVGRGYYGVPEGHTMVGGWDALNRTALEYVDVDGDGTREVVSAENGVFNRVTVFSGAGEPLYNAQFGPGDKRPYANLRDMAVADLDGDGDMEILVATGSGLIVALDHECNKVWSERTPTPPTQLEVSAGAVFAGCEGGEVLRIDRDGQSVAIGHAAGRIEALHLVGGRVMVATDRGEVKTFAP